MIKSCCSEHYILHECNKFISNPIVFAFKYQECGTGLVEKDNLGN